MQHPLTAGRLDALYTWLEPGIVLAQPLLLLTAAGRRAEGAAWRCMSGGRPQCCQAEHFCLLDHQRRRRHDVGWLLYPCIWPQPTHALPPPHPPPVHLPQSTWDSSRGVHYWRQQQSSSCSCATTGGSSRGSSSTARRRASQVLPRLSQASALLSAGFGGAPCPLQLKCPPSWPADEPCCLPAFPVLLPCRGMAAGCFFQPGSSCVGKAGLQVAGCGRSLCPAAVAAARNEHPADKLSAMLLDLL